MTKYALKAIFLPNNEGEPRHTYYPEVTFDTEEDAINAINAEYGETLSQLSTVDSGIDPDLFDYYFDDLDVYTIGTEI